MGLMLMSCSYTDFAVPVRVMLGPLRKAGPVKVIGGALFRVESEISSARANLYPSGLGEARV